MNAVLPADIDHVLKVLLLGDAGVGKSSILVRFVDGSYSVRLNSTIGVDFKVKVMDVPDKDGSLKKVKLSLWDTAGQERFRTLTSSFYRGAHAVIFVYDVTSQPSFDNLPSWLQEVEQSLPNPNLIKILVSNKIDETRAVSREDAVRWSAYNHMELFEVSAKSKEGVDELFDRLVRQIIATPGVQEKMNSPKPTKVDLSHVLREDAPAQSSCC